MVENCELDGSCFAACGSPLLPPGFGREKAKSLRRGGLSALVGLGVGLAERIHTDGGHLLLLEGTVVVVDLGVGDLIHDFHALGDLAEGRVLLIEMRGVLMHDEELASGGVGVHGARHGQDAALVLEIVLKAVHKELALDAVAGAAHAGAGGVAALDHKVFDDAVEDQAVIEALVGQINEVIDALRRDLGIELALDDAAVFHGDGEDGIGHISGSFLSSRGPSAVWRRPGQRPRAYRTAFCRGRERSPP